MSTNDRPGRADPDNLLYDGAAQIVAQEREHLAAWRGQPPQVGLALSGGGIRSASYGLGVLQSLAHERTLPKFDYLSTVSGGGYIGASLSYLLYQSQRDAGKKGPGAHSEFDTSRENFPYASYPMVSAAPPAKGAGEGEALKGWLLRRLRENASYLAPGGGITLLSLAGVLLRNVATSTVVHVAVLVVFFQTLFSLGLLGLNRELQRAQAVAGDGLQWPASNPMLKLAAGALVIFALASLVYLAMTRFFDQLEKLQLPGRSAARAGQRLQAPYRMRRTYDVLSHWLLLAALAAGVIGALPWVHELLVRHELFSLDSWLAWLSPSQDHKPAAVGAVATVIGLIGNLWGYLQARGSDKPRVPTGLVVGLASALLLFGVLLLVYLLTRWANLLPIAPGWILAIAAGVLFAFGWWPEVNYLSLHRYYRDRLLELFMPDLAAVRRNVNADVEVRVSKSIPGDATMLGELCQLPVVDERLAPASQPSAAERKLRRGPYPIINANVVLAASRNPRYRARGGDNFILSPLFCGSSATGWTRTEPAPDKGLTLATAMAISGAALNPNAGPGGEGVTRQPVLSVLMGMLNLRLGFWTLNPACQNRMAAANESLRWTTPNLIHPGLSESFGRENLKEDAGTRFVLLTDGGHFENLGLYELVRRRLKLIVVCDATADPDFKFGDLSNAIEKVRTDFGAIIELSDADLQTLIPVPADGKTPDPSHPPTAHRGYLIAPIRYSLRSGQSADGPTDHGTLVLLKATFFHGLGADLLGYRRGHPAFPNQSTGDQFFDEKQFEAYRELGFQTCWRMLQDLRTGSAETRSRQASDAAALLFEAGGPGAVNA